MNFISKLACVVPFAYYMYIYKNTLEWTSVRLPVSIICECEFPKKKLKYMEERYVPEFSMVKHIIPAWPSKYVREMWRFL